MNKMFHYSEYINFNLKLFFMTVSEENEFENVRNAPMTSSFSAGELDHDKKKSKKSKNILGLFRCAK